LMGWEPIRVSYQPVVSQSWNIVPVMKGSAMTS
jgi:hypothetical protein